MIYIILAGAFMVATGIVLANYELVKQRRDRSERLRQSGASVCPSRMVTQWRQGLEVRATGQCAAHFYSGDAPLIQHGTYICL